MATITSFDEWLGSAQIEDHEDVWSLYRAIMECAKIEPFNCEESNGKWFITAPYSQHTLMLASEEARRVFLRQISVRYCGGDDIENWYEIQRTTVDKD
jgi:hypothetical protein